MAVNVNVRDVTFKFEDSCNCCLSCLCISKKPSPQKLIYVNSRGELEAYKDKKVKDLSIAFTRSLMHLRETLNRKISSCNGTFSEFDKRLVTIIESIHEIKCVNLEHIEDINKLMIEYLSNIENK